MGGRGLELGDSRLQVQGSNHSATSHYLGSFLCKINVTVMYYKSVQIQRCHYGKNTFKIRCTLQFNVANICLQMFPHWHIPPLFYFLIEVEKMRLCLNRIKPLKLPQPQLLDKSILFPLVNLVSRARETLSSLYQGHAAIAAWL